jgi:hypothetical protein
MILQKHRGNEHHSLASAKVHIQAHRDQDFESAVELLEVNVYVLQCNYMTAGTCSAFMLISSRTILPKLCHLPVCNEIVLEQVQELLL